MARSLDFSNEEFPQSFLPIVEMVATDPSAKYAQHSANNAIVIYLGRVMHISCALPIRSRQHVCKIPSNAQLLADGRMHVEVCLTYKQASVDVSPFLPWNLDPVQADRETEANHASAIYVAAVYVLAIRLWELVIPARAAGSDRSRARAVGENIHHLWNRIREIEALRSAARRDIDGGAAFIAAFEEVMTHANNPAIDIEDARIRAFYGSIPALAANVPLLKPNGDPFATIAYVFSTELLAPLLSVPSVLFNAVHAKACWDVFESIPVTAYEAAHLGDTTRSYTAAIDAINDSIAEMGRQAPRIYDPAAAENAVEQPFLDCTGALNDGAVNAVAKYATRTIAARAVRVYCVLVDQIYTTGCNCVKQLLGYDPEIFA